MKKIYIVGIVGTGKTTLSKNLSKKLNIPCYELDNIIHNHTKEDTIDIFNKIINQDMWIIEDTLRPIFHLGLKKADTIIFMDINKLTRKYRLIKRYIKQKLKIENASYPPSLKMLRKLIYWSNDYELHREERIKTLEDYDQKVLVIKNNHDIKKLLKK